MIKIGLLGGSGRMGQWVSKLIANDYKAKATLGAAPHAGEALATLLESDVVIDFSSPEAMIALAEAGIAHTSSLPAFVVGSTGWKLEGRAKLEELAKRTPVLVASNFSTGVLALIHILKSASPLLEKLGYTPVIVEGHHIHKKDAPSGTAISMQRAISPAGPGNVQTHSIRAGEIIGDHEVTFHSAGDHITVGHFAQDRSIFARGAIDTALWLADKKASGGLLTGVVGIDKYFESIL